MVNILRTNMAPQTGLMFQSVVLISLIFGAVSQECSDQGVCVPGPIDVAHRINNHVGIRASETCGDPSSRYCRMRPLNKCFVCDAANASLSHDVSRIRDKELSSSWQSPTWWDWHQNNPNEPLKANVTISFNKSYLLTGEVLIVWMSPRPFKMILEKSLDRGKTWTALQFYSENCEKRFDGMVNTDTENITVGNFGVYCTEKYSSLILEQGKTKFDFLKRYDEENFWNRQYQAYLTATDLRIRMEYPATDGSENTNKDRDILNQYFYAISDLRITARCQCHGHAKYCDAPNEVGYGCDCRHDTTGLDCERCKPLYNDRPWMPATSWNETNPCKKCECHEHADSCVYNKTLDHGVCVDCKHNTTRYFCEQCKIKFYRNMSRTLEDPKVCLPCNCFPEGILNNGSCNQTTGQCECWQNVTGRQCNHCEDTFWGYILPPVGYCQECNCIYLGTKEANLNCHQVTGQCTCKPNIWTKTCSQCEDGFYDFPKTVNQICLKCDCDFGGSKREICDKVNGTCLCRSHIEGERCAEVPPGYFFPSFSHLKYEAEFVSEGNFLPTSYYDGLDRYFTGRGYGKISENQFITFRVNASVDYEFSIVLRYKKTGGTKETLQLEIISCSVDVCSINSTFNVSQLEMGNVQAVQLNKTVTLRSGQDYIFNLTFISGDQSNSSVEIDSLVLLPKVQDSRVYKKAVELGEALGFTAATIQGCLQNWTNLGDSDSALSICRNITFSVMAEVFDGALACGCNGTGTLNDTQCDTFGGQCRCKDGVTGRSCDRCRPGYFNFTDQGCQPCSCVLLGSVHQVCDPVTGRCPCKPGVITRTCSRCNDSYFGFKTGSGCVDCKCSVNGSIHMQCDDNSGSCPCKNSTDGEKCDRCKDKYFNFTSAGCEPCNCHEGGSESLQCDLQSGLCTCKANANGTKCELCKPGTYHSDAENPDGCSRCFCYGRSRVCSSAKNFAKDYIRVNCYANSNCKANVEGQLSFQDINQTKIIKFSGASEVNLTLPNSFKGNQLHSYSQRIEVDLTFLSVASLNTSWKVIIKGDKNVHTFPLHPAPSLTTNLYHALLHERKAEVNVTTYAFQHDLENLRSVKLMAKSTVQGSVKLGEIRMVTARKDDSAGEEVGFVENCSCPFNYTSLSCGSCNEGYTRSPPKSGHSNPCVLCSCNNRSRECFPKNGTCYNCRIGTEGDRCQRCEPNVDNSTDCRRCYPEFYGLTANSRGCTACDCIMENTRYGNNSVCDMKSGNCMCKPKISGRQCDRCHENAYNSSSVCIDCPECYRLVQVEVNKLRYAIQKLNDTVKRVKNGQIGSATFEARFDEAQRNVEDLVAKANNSKVREDELRREVKKLNETLNQLEETLNRNVTLDQESLESEVSSLDQRKGNVSVLIGRTERLLNQSYTLLTMSIGPAARKAENLSTYLESLTSLFGQLARNSSNQAAQQNSTGQTIADDAATADDTISEAENASQQATGDLDVAVQMIQKLYTDALKTKDFGLKVNSSAYELYTNASVVLTRVLESLDAVRQLQPNNSKLVGDVGAAAANATAQAQALIDRAAKLTQDHASVTREVREAASNTIELMGRVREAEKSGSAMLSESQRAKVEGGAAVALANKTHSDSKEMLSILKNFTRKAEDSKEFADKALLQAQQVNTTSWNAIRYAHQLNASLQSTHRNASESRRQAEMARDISKVENKNVSTVYADAVNVKTQAETAKHTPEYLENLKINATNILSSSETHTNSCENYTKESQSAAKRSTEVAARSTKSDTVSKKLKKEIDRVLVDVDRIQQVNATRLRELRDEISRIRDAFTGYDVKNLIVKLQNATLDQKEFLKKYKQKINDLQEEIVELTQLHESLQSVSCR